MQDLPKRNPFQFMTLLQMIRVAVSTPPSLLWRCGVYAAAVPMLAFLMLMPAPAGAQADSSSLSGTVTDPSGAVVPNARVTVHNDANGQERTVQTNGSGAYTVTNLPAGDYTVRVEAPGFGTVVQKGTHLDQIGRAHV